MKTSQTLSKETSGAPVGKTAKAPLLRIRGLAMRYGTTTALEALDLDVLDGEFLTILGPSGSGKTTLLRLIAGFVAPSAGSIEFDDRDVAGLPINRRPFNTVFQDYALFPHLRVRENVAFGLRVRGTAKRDTAERVAAALETVDLAGLADRYPAELSGGQQQRTALARAMICEPRLILLDEPLAALDAGLRRQMQDFLKSVQRRTGITFLFVTHDQSEAITISDRVCVMEGGRIQQIGDPKTLYYRPASRFVATFFGDNNIIEPAWVVSVATRTVVLDTPLGRLMAEADAPSSDVVALAIRPEALTLAVADSPNQIAGTVEALTFVGSETIVSIRAVDRGTRLTMKTPSNPRERDLPLGQMVTLTFDPSAAALVAADRP